MDDMMKVLTRRSFGAGKARNLMAVLAIALTAVLFTGITTIVIGTSQSFTLTMQMQKMSRSDGELRYMTEDQFEALRRADFVKEAGLRLPVGFLSNVRRHNVELDVADEVQAGLTFCLPVMAGVRKGLMRWWLQMLLCGLLGWSRRLGRKF